MGRKRTRIRFYQRSLENDIRYRGPLSYIHLRMFGWLFLVLAQVGTMMNIATKLHLGSGSSFLSMIIPTLSSLTVPLFLTANFSVILTSQKNYKPLLIKYAAFMIGTTLLFFYLYEHIIGGLFRAYLGSDEVRFEVEGSMMIGKGFIAFNIFLDLFLCSLFIFFLDYTPSKVFVGRKLIIFRLFAVLPVIYEVVMIIIKIKAATRSIILSPFVFPLLTTKPPFSFLAFVFLGLFMMRTKRRFLKQGNTLEQYHDFLTTNVMSLHFSIRMAIIFVVMALLDLFVVVFFTIFISGWVSAEPEVYATAMTTAVNCGFGESIILLFMAPLVLLYSYNRKPKGTEMIDNALPILGILGCILVYVEGFYVIAKLFATKNADLILVLKQSIPSLFKQL